MTKLIWDQVGTREFQAGVNRGVLYPSIGPGVAWNGLTGLTEKPDGGAPTPYYIDGIKYLNIASVEEFNGTIEAFMYPDEFALCDGSAVLYAGVTITQQRRMPFGLAYRTIVGNDLRGTDYGYKLHLVYNILASPTSAEYATLQDKTDPLIFSWDFTTTPVLVPGYYPTAHIVLDSTEISQGILEWVEDILYGTDGREPRLPTIDELIELGINPPVILLINPNTGTGLNPLTLDDNGDLVGIENQGLYDESHETRLRPTAIPGLNILE